FTPGATGNRAALVSIADDAGGSPHSVSLTGIGVAPAVTLSPVSLNFGSQVINTTSAAQAFTLTNTGTAALTISNVTIAGANAGDFALTGGASGSLAPGASQTVSVTFTPS